MAEVYWDLEWTLQQQGFDYAYDKRLYDRLREHHARPVREHFHAGLDYQDKLARFLENHDEPRAAATFPPDVHKAAAVITFLSPGLRFFHQGQFEGRKKRISPHLVTAPQRTVRQGSACISTNACWRCCVNRRFATANGTSRMRSRLGRQLDPRLLRGLRLAGRRWRAFGRRRQLCPQPEPVPRAAAVRGPRRQIWRLQDQLGSACYDWDGNELQAQGLYLDLAPWQAVRFFCEALLNLIEFRSLPTLQRFRRCQSPLACPITRSSQPCFQTPRPTAGPTASCRLRAPPRRRCVRNHDPPQPLCERHPRSRRRGPANPQAPRRSCGILNRGTVRFQS